MSTRHAAFASLVLALGLAAHAGAQAPADSAVYARVARVLASTPLVDGHSDILRHWVECEGCPRGFDAYDLIGPLYGDDGTPWTVRGMSGDLSLDAQGRVRRVLPLAQFRNGRPVALDTSLGEQIDARGLIGQR